MPDFFWRAAASDGNVVTGRLSAASEVAAIRQLRSQGLTPLAVQDAEQAARTGVAQAFQTVTPAAEGADFRPAKVRVDKSPVKAKDVLAFTSELAIMLRAGLAPFSVMVLGSEPRQGAGLPSGCASVVTGAVQTPSASVVQDQRDTSVSRFQKEPRLASHTPETVVPIRGASCASSTRKRAVP